MSEQRQFTNNCDRCNNTAVYKCTGCDFKLCEKCYNEIHPPSRKGHVPMPIETLDMGPEVMSTKPWCDKHKYNPLESVCLNHMQCVCCNCLTDSYHRNCCFIPIEKFNNYLYGRATKMEKEFESIGLTNINYRNTRSPDDVKKRIEETFKILIDEIDKCMKSSLDNLENRHNEVMKSLEERKKEYEEFGKMWIVANGGLGDNFFPVKRCGAMYEVERLFKTIKNNDIASVIEVNDDDSFEKVSKSIKSLSFVDRVTKVCKPVIPTCSYDNFLCVHASFMSSAVNYLREGQITDKVLNGIDYKFLLENYPVIEQTERWVKSLPLVCVCDLKSFSEAIKIRGFYSVNLLTFIIKSFIVIFILIGKNV